MISNAGRLLLALALITGVRGDRAAAADKPLVVHAAYTTDIAEPWNQVIHNALVSARKAGRIKYTWKDKLARPAELEKNISDAAARKPDMIVCDAFADAREVKALAGRHPKIAFVVGADSGPQAPNVSVFDSVMVEPAFLCGLIAGKLTKSNVIGVVAGHAEPENNRNINAFLAGARAANPKVKWRVAFIESWFDPAKAKQAALKQIAAGADVLYAERAGVIEACQEKKVLAIGNLVDQHALAPDTVVTGPIWDMKPAFDHVFKQVEAGKYEAENLRRLSTLKTGGARLAPWHGWDKKLPAEVVKLVEEKRAAIKSGKLKVNASTDKPRSTVHQEE